MGDGNCLTLYFLLSLHATYHIVEAAHKSVRQLLLLIDKGNESDDKSSPSHQVVNLEE